jgi:N-acylneuraminate cytidylyltransferase
MRQESEFVGVIPMRGGSKGLPNKNLAPLNGMPLAAYTIKAAMRARNLQQVYVSTDGDEIADVCGALGVSVLRHPAELSLDDSPTFPVIRWAIDDLSSRGILFENCAVLRVTTPLRSANDIDTAISMFLRTPDADSLVSVVALAGGHPKRLKKIDENGWIVDEFEPEGYYPVRRQSLDTVYIRNGGIYLSRCDIIRQGRLWGDRCMAYVMPPERSININTAYDLKLAEYFVSRADRDA